MIRQLGFELLLLTIAGSLGITHLAQAQSTENLSTGNVTIEVNALRNQEGNVCLKLFHSSEGFPNNDENALQKTCVPIDNSTVADPATDGSVSTQADSAETPLPETTTAPTGSTPPTEPSPEPITESGSESDLASTFRYTFENLPYGNYAVAIYHDRNSNERLNRGLFGMPEEGYGFSNDAPANFGPAKFDDAVFAVESADITVPIRMRYP